MTKKLKSLLILYIAIITSTASYAYFKDSVLVFVSKVGYQVQVVNPGRYVVVRNFSNYKVEGRMYIVNAHTLRVGHTIVPIRNIARITVKSMMYPISHGIYKAGLYLMKTLPLKIFKTFGFRNTGPAAVLLLVIGLLVAIVFVFLGLLLLFIALPGLLVGKTYDMRYWRLYIKPKR